jgi:hypothetical protein
MHQLMVTLSPLQNKRNCTSMGYIDTVTEALTNFYQLHHYQCRGTVYTVYFDAFTNGKNVIMLLSLHYCNGTKLVCYLQKAVTKKL